MFKVQLEKRVLKQLSKLPTQDQKKIFEILELKITKNPFPRDGNPKKLTGTSVCRWRVGDYRVVYVVKNDTVFVTKIQHRKDVYKKV